MCMHVIVAIELTLQQLSSVPFPFSSAICSRATFNWLWRLSGAASDVNKKQVATKKTITFNLIAVYSWKFIQLHCQVSGTTLELWAFFYTLVTIVLFLVICTCTPQPWVWLLFKHLSLLVHLTGFWKDSEVAFLKTLMVGISHDIAVGEIKPWFVGFFGLCHHSNSRAHLPECIMLFCSLFLLF